MYGGGSQTVESCESPLSSGEQRQGIDGATRRLRQRSGETTGDGTMMVVPQDVACPHCRKTCRISMTVSGNTYGAHLWTDGKVEGAMVPDFERIWRCLWCGGCFEESLPDSPEDPSSEKGAARKSVPATRADLEAHLKQGLCRTIDQERRMRIRLWWLGNDPIRESPSIGCLLVLLPLTLGVPAAALAVGDVVLYVCAALMLPALIGHFVSDILKRRAARAARVNHMDPDGPFQANLLRLLSLIDGEDEADILLRAEALRELGRFEHATGTLPDAVSQDRAQWHETLSVAANEGDRMVRRVPRSKIDPRNTVEAEPE